MIGTEGVLLSAVIEEDLDHMNWVGVGSNQPGRMIPSLGSFNIRVNTKKNNRLEVFGIFSDTESSDFGRVMNISEDDEGKWNLNWRVINNDQDLKAIRVTSTIDKKSRVHIFAVAKVEGDRRIVHHSYLEADLKSCKFDIPSWESRIRPSTWQVKARAIPGSPHADDCMLTEEGGYRSLENQLYRIEIHDSKSLEIMRLLSLAETTGQFIPRLLIYRMEKLLLRQLEGTNYRDLSQVDGLR